MPMPQPLRRFTKPATDFTQQLAKLQARGLDVANSPRALRYLANISYYRLSGYWSTFFAPHTSHFRPGTTFDDVLRVYRFDKVLRLLCLDAIERLEIAFRTQLIYHITHYTGDNNWYEQLRHFKQNTPDELRAARKLIGGIYAELGHARKKHFIAEYYRRHDHPRNPPAWMTLEILSFGALYHLFDCFADTKPKLAIANHFHVSLKVFASWMNSLNAIRNTCAHHSRFWDLSMKPMLWLQHDQTGYWLRQFNAPAANTKPYYALSVLNFLMVQVSTRSRFGEKVLQLLREHRIDASNAHHQHMGFPVGWEQETMWHQV
jgi:abortive infection bacteriophage resistance protein